MSTPRLISAAAFFSILTLASCASVQVPYQTVDPIPDQSQVTGTQATTTELGAARFAMNYETGARVDYGYNPEPYRKRATGGSKVNLGILFGARGRDSTDWGQLDNQIGGGVEFSFVPKYFPIGVEIGLLYATTSETVSGIDLDSTTAELYFGPRYEWSIPEGTLKFFVGGGASLIRNDADAIIGSAKQGFDDTTFGGYVHGGLELLLSKTVGIGFDLRGVWSGDASINNVDLNPSYYQGAVLLGLHF